MSSSDLSHYTVEVDVTQPNTSHAQLVGLVGLDKKVLDVGCWTGDLAEALAVNGCEVSGIELDPGAAEIARTRMKEVVVADLDETRASDHFEAGSFDAVVLGDVLEHLQDPVGTLRDVATLLAPEGRVVITIPNVTHGSVRLALLQGRWTYTPTGLLDGTHIRFYTRQAVLDMFAEAGYVVDQLRGTTADPLGVEVEVDADRLPPTLVEWVRDQPDALVYQFVVWAHPAAPGESLDAGDSVLHTIVPDETVRVVDRHTARMQNDIEERHRVLTVRDHIIGLEAATATAQHTAADTRQELRAANRQLKRKNERIAELKATIERLNRRLEANQEPARDSVVDRVRRRVR